MGIRPLADTAPFADMIPGVVSADGVAPGFRRHNWPSRANLCSSSASATRRPVNVGIAFGEGIKSGTRHMLSEGENRIPVTVRGVELCA